GGSGGSGSGGNSGSGSGGSGGSGSGGNSGPGGSGGSSNSGNGGNGGSGGSGGNASGTKGSGGNDIDGNGSGGSGSDGSGGNGGSPSDGNSGILTGPNNGGGISTIETSPSSAADQDRDSPEKPRVYACNERGEERLTNFVNPAYPYRDTGAGICMFRLDLLPGVCQVRVDVIEMSLAPPTEGVCVRQYLTVQGAVWPPGVQRICGTNTNTHFYIEVDDSVPFPYVELAVSSQAGLSYRWGLWVTQIDCRTPSPIK
ncbi:unnamed protein product, partial [Meganyctiphanes norvegica]